MNEKSLSLIKNYLITKISPYLIILFGSIVKGNLKENSDIDIAFLSKQKFNDYDIFMIGQGLADLIDKEIDLIDLEKASTVFQAQILHTGKEIYCTDKNKKILFQALTYKKYARLNEERAPIIKKIEERGIL